MADDFGFPRIGDFEGADFATSAGKKSGTSAETNALFQCSFARGVFLVLF